MGLVGLVFNNNFPWSSISSSQSQVFPSRVSQEGGITKQSMLAKLKEKRAKLKQILLNRGTS